MDTNVVIFFVGLTVFSNSIPNDCGVKAILPSVVYTSPFHTPNERHKISALPQQVIAQAGLGRFGGATQVPLRDSRHVEDHEAVLVFSTASYHPTSSWGTPQKIKKQDGTDTPYSFVRLEGDLVRFLSNSTAATSLAGAKLPALAGMVCPAKMQSLKPDYLPPYTGAAAVFELPQGTLTTCLSTSSQGKDRLDTKLVLTSPGPYFTVSASTMRTRKELRLKAANGQVELLVANVPKRYLSGDTSVIAATALNGIHHDHAYFEMGSTGTGSCAMNLEQWYQVMKTQLGVVPPCSMTGPNWKTTPGEGPGKVLEAVAAASFECSNTQWP
ncbi:MAG TPA: hypothetical protein VEK57_25610 [Thermoanaerobaculia bacterium]|nr:hypothetical protein [Thermoanaerobaculia bacterium]